MKFTYGNYRKVKDKTFSYQNKKALSKLSVDEQELLKEWRLKLIQRKHIVKPADLKKMWIAIKRMLAKGLKYGSCRFIPLQIKFYWEAFQEGLDRLQGMPLGHFEKYLNYISAYYNRIVYHQSKEFREKIQKDLREDTVRGWLEF